MRTVRSILFAALFAATLALVAQPGCEDEPVEEQFIPDAGPCAPGGGCIAACAPGNSQGIGKGCTKGGGQCNPPPAGSGFYILFCTSDVSTDPTDPSFCTAPCSQDAGGCGEGASCVGDPRGSGCVPNTCLSGDAGPDDAGPADAGPADAGDAGTA